MRTIHTRGRMVSSGAGVKPTSCQLVGSWILRMPWGALQCREKINAVRGRFEGVVCTVLWVYASAKFAPVTDKENALVGSFAEDPAPFDKKDFINMSNTWAFAEDDPVVLDAEVDDELGIYEAVYVEQVRLQWIR